MPHLISLSHARSLISRFKKEKRTMYAPPFQSDERVPYSETFDRAAFDALLKQDGCTQLRIYFGLDEKNMMRMVIVGVDRENRDIVGAATRSLEENTSVIVEEGIRCPDICPPDSPLTTELP